MKILVIALSLLATSCAATQNAASVASSIEIIDETHPDTTKSDAKNLKITLKEESKFSSVKACGVDTLPELTLGGGLVAAGSSIASGGTLSAVGAGYYVFKYFWCFLDRQNERPIVIDMTQVAEVSTKAINSSLEDRYAEFQTLKRDILNLKAETQQLTKLNAGAVDTQKQQLNQYANELMKIIDKKIEEIKNGKFVVEEEVIKIKKKKEELKENVEKASEQRKK